MEIHNLLNQLGHELDLQQQQNQINYLCNENQKLKNNSSTVGENIIDSVYIINRIANAVADL